MSFIPLYAGISVHYDEPISKFDVFIHDGSWYFPFSSNVIKDNTSTNELIHDTIISFLDQYQKKNKAKFILSGVINSHHDDRLKQLSRRLYLELDIIPCIVKSLGLTLTERSCSVARKAFKLLSFSHIPGVLQVSVGKGHLVLPTYNNTVFINDLSSYKFITPPDTFESIVSLSDVINKKGKSIVFFNSTPQGGGVAIIRHSTIRLMQLLDVNAYWFVMKPNPNVFEITKKKIHNVLHGITNDIPTPDEFQLWYTWCKNNFDRYWSKDDVIASADVIVIDDPQPCGMIPLLRKLNPKSKIVYRSHIELRKDLIDNVNTPQHKLFKYLFDNYISLCDIFVSHPLSTFIPDMVIARQDSIRITLMPAITDPLDGLNKKLDLYSILYYQHLFNLILFEQTGENMDFSNRYFVQISRFDPSKGQDDLIDAYVLFRRNYIINEVRPIPDIPKLIIAGHGSIDDPEAVVIFSELMTKLSSIDPEIRKDIHIVRLPPSDQLLNMLLRCAYISCQLSIREGFEIKVTESLMKGIPMIAYEAGGIPLQISNGYDGYLVPVGDIYQVSTLMYLLTMDTSLRNKLSSNALKKKRDSLFTPMNVLRWLQIMNE